MHESIHLMNRFIYQKSRPGRKNKIWRLMRIRTTLKRFKLPRWKIWIDSEWVWIDSKEVREFGDATHIKLIWCLHESIHTYGESNHKVSDSLWINSSKNESIHAAKKKHFDKYKDNSKWHTFARGALTKTKASKNQLIYST